MYNLTLYVVFTNIFAVAFSALIAPNLPRIIGLALEFIVFFLAWKIALIMIKFTKYYNTPSLEDYWQQNPNCKTESGTKCKVCGSKNIRSWGLDNKADKERIHSCHQCNATLYKTGSFNSKESYAILFGIVTTAIALLTIKLSLF